MVLIGYIFDIPSDRKLCEELRYNLAYRWFCKLNIDDFTPDHSSISRIRDRYDYEVFSLFFDRIVGLCKEAGLVKGKKIITDGTLIAANASLDSMISKTKLEEKSGAGNTVQHPTVRKLSNHTHISKTDPESSLAKKDGSAKGLKYQGSYFNRC